MFNRDELILVGSKNNFINIAKLEFDKDNFVINKMHHINPNNEIMLHSCLLNENILYILDSFNNMVIKYNIANNEYLECYTGKDPRHICKCLDNLYITNFESDSISIIDADTCILTGTVTVGVKPHDILANDSNTKLYIACYEENEILEYDINNSEKKYLNIDGKPMHLILFNNCLFVLSYLVNDVISTEINIINLETYAVEETYFIKEITTNFVYDEDTNNLFVLAIESGTVYSVNLTSKQIKKQIHLNGYLEDISVSKQYLYVVNSSRNYISIIDKFSIKQIENIYLDFTPLYIKTL